MKSSNNNLTEFNAGGSHESNPFGGVPQGVGSNGKMNTVEEGETKVGNYVFSDRMTISKELANKYNLNKRAIGKSFAKYSKIVNEINKESNNPVDKESTDEMLQRVSQAQEEQRIIQNPEAAMQAMQAMMASQNQTAPSGDQNQLKKGGYFSNDFLFGGAFGDGEGGMTQEGFMSGMGSAVGAAGAGLGMINNITQGTETGKSGLEAGKGALSGAMAGASVGGPWGAAIGGVVGGISGLIGAGKAKKELLEKQRRNTFAENLQYRGTDFAMGGEMNTFEDGSFLDFLGQDKDPLQVGGIYNPSGYLNYNNTPTTALFGTDTTPPVSMVAPKPRDLSGFDRSTVGDPYLDSQNRLQTMAPNAENPNIIGPQATFKDKVSAFLGGQGGEDAEEEESLGSQILDKAKGALRYAPIAMNLYQLSKLDKPEYERYDRLADRYDPQRVDRAALENRAARGERNLNRALTESSGGDSGALRSNMLANRLQTGKVRSDALFQADAAERADSQFGQQFNLGVNSTNLQQSNTERLVNAQNKGAYETQKSKLLSQLGTDAGNIGLEEMRKKYPEQMGWLYDYLGGKIASQTKTAKDGK